ncbi:MAG: decarboxylating NADP(+)-dependent phosphogluconate dehydrogenase [Methylicorpusculum sp.]|uniref:decarboxylating NADP(+)-dependent phosphogluconate dehydrogenase n=1 Tax=Methylicorpusculum sp. TaxID=2713644 RepID=UPI002727BE31|nr:decarboxylating NADP(+)-dependent phosphogluconate dehydrogenase [Methylicorpusculum sp.]MDO8846047.1 decarboxylating NADP(+)-dependent phosphogluconate dehydrogenase [Methylicorpusculum sp.]MDO8940724.1 decarboxylating NADP(+)-dependent phosphogluconate dehydrogenase [Methylicorpusculum sp.]MDO9239170.1 decarboxylating NADP(+)-dependent phosphogluconate dehydrogenase [Methylicorpusculum sp.]MDP2179931.1 decarboxylating NADP(+)-dependent phosphogluconate dehydrogenase [Methylicorpusculum sp.
MKANIGLIGLAVMGQNLVLNMSDHGFKVAVHNRSPDKTEDFLNGPAKDKGIIGAYSLDELLSNLELPRVVMLMVKAGEVVDQYIEQLVPLMTAGDIIIDGGNSLFTDTNRRTKALKEKNILYIGTGVSGGEEGARNGPSIMPGGNPDAWERVRAIFQSISAQVDNQPCCQWVGDNGAGHYVKMVHNGIEYGDMQLICEAYQLLSEGLGLSADECAGIFAQWNQGELSSYLIEITSNIMAYKDTDGEPLLEKILDTAGQKGTGKWTGINALDLGIPLTLIGESVFARCLSAMKDERVRAAERLPKPVKSYTGEKQAMIDAIRDALYASKIISYAQGFRLMREAAAEYQWSLNYGEIALMWRGGCIIRSAFLNDIKAAYTENPQLENLLLADFFVNAMQQTDGGWRKAVIAGIELGIPTPAFSSALAYYDGYRTARLPANLLQAQRDYFGAHTYERTDQPRGQFFHTDWTGYGGKTASTTYTV